MMKYLLVITLGTVAILNLNAQALGAYAVRETAALDASAPCSVCTPWQYNQADDILYRWDGAAWVNYNSMSGGSTDDQVASEVPFTANAFLPGALEVQSAVDDLATILEANEALDGTQTINIGDLVTLSGVALNATNLGAFTGTTITDNRTVKQALQELETAVEGVSGSGSNLSATRTATQVTVLSDTGTDAVLQQASVTEAGVMTAADKIKLDGVLSYAWYDIGLDGIQLYATSDPTAWVTEVNPQEYTIVVPINENLDRIAYVSTNGVNRNSSTGSTIFNINTSATANTNTSYANTFTPSAFMNNSSGNIVPVGIGGAPAFVASAPSLGIRTLTIQGTTGILDGSSRVQISNISSY